MMNATYHFLTIDNIKAEEYNAIDDSLDILKSGMVLYKDALLSNPNNKESSYAVCLAVVDSVIVGRFILMNSLLKHCNDVILINTGGGILVDERCRGMGVGSTLIREASCNNQSDIYFGALYTRAAYDIFRKTDQMLEIPQYVKERHNGVKKIFDIPYLLKQRHLKRKFAIKKLSKVPEWAGELATSDEHKYMEVHNTQWLQWALDNLATGNPADHQSFYAIYNNKNKPAGFFMIKIRNVIRDGNSFVKANLVEWDSYDLKVLSEVDIIVLALSVVDRSVEKFWTISENIDTGKKIKKYSFKRRGWLAMSIKDKKGQFEDIGDVSQWRIRYGCCNTIIVE